MDHSNHPALMDSLKEAIAQNHARMEALPFMVALAQRHLPLESYVGQLRAMAAIHGTLEHEAGFLSQNQIRNLFLDKPSRLVHLRKDLSVFDRQIIPDSEEALLHTRQITELIRRYRVEKPIDLLGVLYVLQGNTLGNAVHLPDILKTFGSLTFEKAHYYAGYGHNTAKYWKKFRSDMNSLTLDQEKRDGIIRTALDFFDRLENLYTALYPINKDRMVFTAGMLNPEAGDHPVPDNSGEIAAAVAAAEKCRREFPYFDQRYQARGQSFAKSDSAWLATLSELPYTQLLTQVEWLGRVLSNRGMPRITLERQLELLHVELTAAAPSKTSQYDGLREASQSLTAQRLMHISEKTFNRLTHEFQLATDGELKATLKNTGALIVSAVCDEDAGITGAVSSLAPWLTDTHRFLPSWIAAVKVTLEQAHKSLKKSR